MYWVRANLLGGSQCCLWLDDGAPMSLVRGGLLCPWLEKSSCVSGYRRYPGIPDILDSGRLWNVGEDQPYRSGLGRGADREIWVAQIGGIPGTLDSVWIPVGVIIWKGL